jgi:NADH-ubiquinone oxidoreductase chain 5
MIGTLTLMLASLAALMELDAKKIVALSTLSQLGLMVLSLSLGNLVICLYHVLTHALAKANLFLIVGRFLHEQFSQQDARKLPARLRNLIRLLGLLLRVISLSGVFFIRGFYSKERVLIIEFVNLNRILSLIGFCIISGLTLAYCTKLLLSLIRRLSLLRETNVRAAKYFSVFVLRACTVAVGGFLRNNLFLIFLPVKILRRY